MLARVTPRGRTRVGQDGADMVRLFDAGLREDRPVVVHDKVLTAANAITLLRLLGLPLFAWLMLGPAAYGKAAIVLAVVATTDWIDGYVARRFDQVTRIGQLIDPLIDRALLATAGIVFGLEGIVDWWVIALVVGRDALLLVGALAFFRGNPGIPVSRTGKFATACLLVGIPSFLLAAMDWAGADLWRWIAWAFTIVGIATYWSAGAQYVRLAVPLLRTRPRG